MRGVAIALGSIVRRWLTAAGEMAVLAWLGFRALSRLSKVRLGVVVRVAVRQIYFTGIQALLLTGLIAFLLGAVVVIQAVTRLEILGAAGFIGDLLVIAVLRELGPILTAIIVIGRSGTAMASELATMRQRGEVDDLETLGIDPIQYLFLPRLAGAILSLFGLIIYFDLLAVLGGYLALAVLSDSPVTAYLGSVAAALSVRDIVLVPAKGLLFGALFAVISCHRGLSVGISPTEIPRAATGAVVASLVGIFVLDSFLAAVVYA